MSAAFDIKHYAIRIFDNEVFLGSGFFVSSEIIVTCAHVVRGKTPTKGQFDDSISFKLELTNIERDDDIALLKALDLPASCSCQILPLMIAPLMPISSGFNIDLYGYSFPGRGSSSDPISVCYIGNSMKNGKQFLTLDRANSISEGHSGGPLFIKASHALIGVIVKFSKETENNRRINEAYAIPATVLLSLVPNNTFVEYISYYDHELRDRTKSIYNSYINSIKLYESDCVNRLILPTLRSVDNELLTIDNITAWLYKQSVPHVQIIGDSGSGKSSFAIELWNRLSDADEINAPVPLYLCLSNINMQEKRVADEYITSQIAKIYMLDNTSLMKKDSSTSNRHFILILDGYDEIQNDHTDNVNSELRYIIQCLLNTYILVTTRHVLSSDDL
ncbi:hypothetical protein AGMMS49992_18210 [Clostridia bacterium]|nr:hypothetical protein AGMMS49992_18210 [Clostridia bacterium]